MQHIDQHLAKLEANLHIEDRNSAISALRELGLCDFSYALMEMPNWQYPRLSGILPKFASVESQMNWTGSHGEVLLGQSLNFVRSVADNYTQLSGKSLKNKKILDFGCGYGRLLRVFNFYTNEIYGVDPWDESIRLCNEAGLTQNIYLSDYLPQHLPVAHDFDLAYAFSVFTHLSERATKISLKALHKHVAPNGILCITIRPIEYWRRVDQWSNDQVVEQERQHQTGFAFLPHDRAPVDGDITYGDTSMTIDWLASTCRDIGWRIERQDRSLDDAVQLYVFLRRL